MTVSQMIRSLKRTVEHEVLSLDSVSVSLVT